MIDMINDQLEHDMKEDNSLDSYEENSVIAASNPMSPVKKVAMNGKKTKSKRLLTIENEREKAENRLREMKRAEIEQISFMLENLSTGPCG